MKYRVNENNNKNKVAELGSADGFLLGLLVRIPSEGWMFVVSVVCVVR